jgi:PAS domain S-box-containing protein
VVQGLVALVTATHAVVEGSEVLAGHDLGAAYFVPASLYFIPVIYSSLNFGMAGAVPTAAWSGLLAIPNVIIWHRALERFGEGMQVVIMVAIAVIVASRVDRETAARSRAEAEESARRISEAKYRSLFDSAGEAILVLNASGVIEDANAAAGMLLGRRVTELRQHPLTWALGQEAGARLFAMARGEDRPRELALEPDGGLPRWVEPICNSITDPAGSIAIQALLRDVTKRRERQRGLETYAQQMLRAQEAERLRIAREIHDGSQQSLVLLCRQLDALEESSELSLAKPLLQAIRDSRELAEAIAAELRRFSRDLRPSILDDLGLVPAVRWVVNDVALRTGMSARLVVEGPERRVHADVALCVFRIVQEAIRNVEHHAGASQLAVALAYENRQLRLAVTDDGRGFDVASRAGQLISERFGLVGMQERARLLGGDFQVASTPGRGTRIDACIPVTAGDGVEPAKPDGHPTSVRAGG